MRSFDERNSYFDLHRKDHKGRAAIIPLALIASAAIWIGIFALASRFF